MTKSELLKYIDSMLTQRSDGNIGLLRVRQYVEDNMKDMPSAQQSQKNDSNTLDALDCVSRKAVIDAINTHFGFNIEEEYGSAVQEVINGLPSAQPERKKGKWIEFDSEEDKYDVIKCHCCNHVFTVDSYHWTDIGFIKDDFKFCPNCGADMRGEENG